MADLRTLAAKHGIPPDALRALAESKADYFMLHSWTAGTGNERLDLFVQGQWPDRLVDGLLTAWAVAHPLRATMSPRAAELDAAREGRPVDFEAVARESREAGRRAEDILKAKADEERAAAEQVLRIKEEALRRSEAERARRQEVLDKQKRLEEVRRKRLEAEREESELEARLTVLRPKEEPPEERRFDLTM